MCYRCTLLVLVLDGCIIHSRGNGGGHWWDAVEPWVESLIAPRSDSADEMEKSDVCLTPVEQYGRLSVQGNKIVDVTGEPVRLRGMSFFWSQWTPMFWNAEVVQWLADDWGVTLVRAAMGIEMDGYLANPQAMRDLLIAVVDAAIDAGIYVIIDWHDHNAESHTNEAMAFFEEMAKMYGSQPNVMFELFNEPTWQDWASIIKPYHEAVVPVIRRHSDNIVILGSKTWSQEVDEAARDPVDGENVAYTLHFYSASWGQALRDKAQAALDYGQALFITEYGLCESSGNGRLDLEETQAWYDFLEENSISDANWAIGDKDESCSALRPGASPHGGWGAQNLTTSGAFVRESILAADGRRCATKESKSKIKGKSNGTESQTDRLETNDAHTSISTIKMRLLLHASSNATNKTSNVNASLNATTETKDACTSINATNKTSDACKSLNSTNQTNDARTSVNVTTGTNDVRRSIHTVKNLHDAHASLNATNRTDDARTSINANSRSSNVHTFVNATKTNDVHTSNNATGKMGSVHTSIDSTDRSSDARTHVNSTNHTNNAVALVTNKANDAYASSNATNETSDVHASFNATTKMDARTSINATNQTNDARTFLNVTTETNDVHRFINTSKNIHDAHTSLNAISRTNDAHTPISFTNRSSNAHTSVNATQTNDVHTSNNANGKTGSLHTSINSTDRSSDARTSVNSTNQSNDAAASLHVTNKTNDVHASDNASNEANDAHTSLNTINETKGARTSVKATSKTDDIHASINATSMTSNVRAAINVTNQTSIVRSSIPATSKTDGALTFINAANTNLANTSLNATNATRTISIEDCSESLIEDCRQTRCCKDSAMRCYEKNERQALCKHNCTPGVDPKDGKSDPWSCKPLGARTPHLAAEHVIMKKNALSKDLPFRGRAAWFMASATFVAMAVVVSLVAFFRVGRARMDAQRNGGYSLSSLLAGDLEEPQAV